MTNNLSWNEDELPLKKNGLPHEKDNPSVTTHHVTITERELTTAQALYAYTPAVFWSAIVCMCAVMEGYDIILIPNFFAFPSFAKKYGVFDVNSNTYQLKAEWQMGLGIASGISAVLGIFVNGYLVSWFGHKRVLLGALLSLACVITVVFMASNITILFIGELLCGFPWGIIASLAPAYSSEILPLTLRSYLIMCMDLCFLLGQLLAAGTLEGLLSITSSWSYRGAFALQWLWPVLLTPVLLFMPESPWHLVRKGKTEEARNSLARLQRKNAKTDIRDTLNTIIRTDALEQQLVSGTSYCDCFRGTERRRTEIASMAFAGQMLSGIAFAYNATYFFQQIGLSTSKTYKISLCASAISVCAILFSWICVMPFVGHRNIYFCGMTFMSLILFLIGFLSFFGDNNAIFLTQASLTIVWSFTFHLSVGQLGWAIPAEIGSTRLRQKTICIARICFYLVNLFSKVVEPYFMNPTKLNLKGYTGFFWGSTALLTAIWTFYRLPETKNRTFEDLDILFENKVPTRQFASYVITSSCHAEEKSSKPEV